MRNTAQRKTGRIITKTSPGQSRNPAGLLQRLRYEYDGLDRLTAVTDPNGLRTSYAYVGEAAHPARIISPDSGLTSYSYDEKSQSFKCTDANGVSKTSRFDRHMRPLRHSYPDRSQDVSFSYDPDDGGKLRPKTMSDPSGIYEYDYDYKGRLRAQKALILGREYRSGCTRDPEGRIIGMDYPGGGLLQYQRDARGRISALLLNGRYVARNILRTPEGAIRSLEHGNGLITSRKYDHNGRLLSYGLTGKVKMDLIYNQYNQITELIDRLEPGRSQAFEYDNKRRLIKADGPYGSRIYSYDANANRLSRISEEGVVRYAYKPGSNQVGGLNGAVCKKLDYDHNGQIIQDGDLRLGYNQEGRLIRSQTGDGPAAGYAYNGRGQRVIKSHSQASTVYHYDVEGRLIAESNQQGMMLKQYFWLDRELIALLDGDELFHVHVNHRNEPALVTDQSGETVWQNLTSPFGKSAESYPRIAESYRNFSLNIRLPFQGTR